MNDALRVWLAENLSRGVDADVLVRELVCRGTEVSVARAAAAAARVHPAVLAASERSRLGRELRALMDLRSVLSRQAGARSRVERVRSLSAPEFLERFYLPHRPVILTGFMEDWPLMARWQPHALMRSHGDVEVEVMMGREARADHDLEPEPCRTRMRLGDFIRRLLEGGPTNDLYLTARNFALERQELQSLRDDLRFPTGFLRPSSAHGAFKLWIGPAGTRTALHHDLGSVLFGQVSGRKRFWLVPSFQTERVYNHHSVWSEVDAEHPDPVGFPAFEKAHIHEAVVEPGEMLLIPAGWWHQVHALDVSVSVTFQELDVPGGNTWWRFAA
ncbi:cupin-like domain-containing protein [Corallococcus sp. H22C18031201]|nr:cupin-like domain-containing protein [Corallococcus sp. H22C18031201]